MSTLRAFALCTLVACSTTPGSGGGDDGSGSNTWSAAYTMPSLLADIDGLASDGTRVYVVAASTGVGALDATSGTPIWKITPPSRPSAGSVVIGDTLVFDTEGTAQNTLVGLDPKTGATLWTKPHLIRLPQWRSAIAGGVVMISSGGSPVGIKLSDGSTVFTTPANSGDSVDPTGDGSQFYYVDEHTVGAPVLTAVDPTGAMRWHTAITGSPHSVFATGGLVFVDEIGGNGDLLHAYNPTTGALLFQITTPNGVLANSVPPADAPFIAVPLASRLTIGYDHATGAQLFSVAVSNLITCTAGLCGFGQPSPPVVALGSDGKLTQLVSSLPDVGSVLATDASGALYVATTDGRVLRVK